MNTNSLIPLRDDKLSPNLYQIFQFAQGETDRTTESSLRKQVADLIKSTIPLHHFIDKSQTIDQLCHAVSRGETQGTDVEIFVLARLRKLDIYVVSFVCSNGKRSLMAVKKFVAGETKSSQCLFLQLNMMNSNYEILYRNSRHQKDKKQFIFCTNDGLILNNLKSYVTNHLQGENFRLDQIQSIHIANVVCHTSSIVKRTIKSIETASESREKRPRTVSNQRRANGTSIHDTLDENDYQSQILQRTLDDPELFDRECPVPRTNEALPTSPLMISDQTTAVNPVIESQRKMRLRVEPKENFRGRTQHEYKPAKAVTRNGRPSKARAPLYVADRFDHHYLDLLIPAEYFQDRRKTYRIGIHIITREIDGYAYIHPYFKFQKHPTDPEIDDENPLFIELNVDDDLISADENFLRFRLYLVLIVLTNNELMNETKTLTIFSGQNAVTSADFHGGKVKISHRCHDTLKKDFDLHKLRFAFSLWTRNSADETFGHVDQVDCISEILNENRKFVDSAEK